MFQDPAIQFDEKEWFEYKSMQIFVKHWWCLASINRFSQFSYFPFNILFLDFVVWISSPHQHSPPASHCFYRWLSLRGTKGGWSARRTLITDVGQQLSRVASNNCFPLSAEKKPYIELFFWPTRVISRHWGEILWSKGKETNNGNRSTCWW